MAKKADVIRAANIEYRTGIGKVGERLSVSEREEHKLHLEKRWTEAQKGIKAPEVEKPPEMPKPAEPKPCTADLSKLGMRMRERIVTRKVQSIDLNGRPMEGDRGPITSMKDIQVTEPVLQSNLTLEEALTLGTQEWRAMENKAGQFTCGVEGRRFVVEKDVYGELCKVQ